MNFRGHFELTLKNIPHGGLFGTLNMLLLYISGFLCQKSSCTPFFSGSKWPTSRLNVNSLWINRAWLARAGQIWPCDLKISRVAILCEKVKHICYCFFLSHTPCILDEKTILLLKQRCNNCYFH